jgi:hypothetical protein
VNKKEAKKYLSDKVRALLEKEPPAPLDAVAAFIGPASDYEDYVAQYGGELPDDEGEPELRDFQRAFRAGKAPSPWTAKRMYARDEVYGLTQAAFSSWTVQVIFVHEDCDDCDCRYCDLNDYCEEDDRDEQQMLSGLKVRVCTETLESAPFSLDMARLGNLFELLAHFKRVPDAALVEYDRRLLAQRAKRALAAEKKRKIQEMTRGAVEVWLARIAGELGLPYRIDTGKDNVVFSLLLEEERRALVMDVPFAGFQETLPTLAERLRPVINAARAYLAAKKASGAYLMPARGSDDDWIMPTIKRGEEQ